MENEVLKLLKRIRTTTVVIGIMLISLILGKVFMNNDDFLRTMIVPGLLMIGILLGLLISSLLALKD